MAMPSAVNSGLEGTIHNGKGKNRIIPSSGNATKLYLFLHPGRAEPAGYWLRPVSSESDWSSPLLCQHPLLCPTGPQGKAGDHNTDRPSDRMTRRMKKKQKRPAEKQPDLMFCSTY